MLDLGVLASLFCRGNPPSSEGPATCGDGASWVWACGYLQLLRVMLSKMTDNVLSRLLHFLIGILETFIGGNAHRLEVKIKQGIVTIPYRRVFHGGNDPPRLLG